MRVAVTHTKEAFHTANGDHYRKPQLDIVHRSKVVEGAVGDFALLVDQHQVKAP